MARGSGDTGRKLKPDQRHFVAQIRTTGGIVKSLMTIDDYLDSLQAFVANPRVTGWTREHISRLDAAFAVAESRLGGKP